MPRDSNTVGPLATEDWDRLEPIIRRFESAWQAGTRPTIEEYLPAADADRQAVLVELAHADLERRLKAGEATCAADYLQRFPELAADRSAAVALIASEYELRRRLEPAPPPADFLDRYPQYRAELAARLSATSLPAPAVPAGPVTTAAALAEALRAAALLDAGRLDEVARLAQSFPEARALARELLARGWLTAFQVNHLLQGKGHELIQGHYYLLERLGRGGMGQVFKARHRLMNRVVALKIIRQDFLAQPEIAQRFTREIQAAAQLSHPNIVTAFDAEHLGETHYLVMEYVEGQDLSRLVKERGPLPIMQACDYIRQAALGLQHAHERGLVHRDIKPSNLLVSAKGSVVKVLDMGLARLDLLGGQADTHLTAVGAIMGTPDYIAPEQALDTRQADHRSDIYSLGCTLYHLLTGRTPYPEGSVTQKLLWHQQVEPEAVERLRPEMPPGLALVLRKMMARHPGDRYQSAAEVAGALELFSRYAVPIVVAGPAPGSPPAPRPVVLASPASETVSQADAESVAVEPPAPPAAAPALARRRKVLLAAGAGALGLVAVGALLWFRGGAPEVVPAKGISTTTTEVDFEGKPPKELLPEFGEARARHWGPVRCLAVSKDESLVASGGEDGVIRVWDRKTLEGKYRIKGHKGPVLCLAFAPDGTKLLSGGEDATTRLWDLKTGKELRKLAGPNARVVGVLFDPTGQRAFTDCNSTAHLYDVQGGQQLDSLQGVGSWASFTVDGRRWARLNPKGDAVTVYEWQDRRARDLDILAKEKAEQKARQPGGDKDKKPYDLPAIGWAALSPDGKEVLCFTSDGLFRLWDAEKAEEIRRFKAPIGIGRITLAPPAGRWAVCHAVDGTLRVCDSSDGKELTQLRGHTGGVGPVAFLPDGKQALTGGEDGTVRLWDLTTGAELAPLNGHTAPVACLAFSKKGDLLLSGGVDRTVYLWDVASRQIRQRFLGHSGTVLGVALSPDGQQVLSGGADGTARLWEEKTAKPKFVRSQVDGSFVSFSPADSRRALLAGHTVQGSVIGAALLNLDNSQVLYQFRNHVLPVRCAAFAPDGSHVLSGGQDHVLRLYETETGKEVTRFPGHVDAVAALSFAADGKHFWSVGKEGWAYWWSVSSRRPDKEVELKDFPKEVSAVAMATAGTKVAASTPQGLVAIWDTGQGKKLVEWRLPGPVQQVVFNPDGTQLATANSNGTIYLFRVPGPEPAAKQ